MWTASAAASGAAADTASSGIPAPYPETAFSRTGMLGSHYDA